MCVCVCCSVDSNNSDKDFNFGIAYTIDFVEVSEDLCRTSHIDNWRMLCKFPYGLWLSYQT